LTTQIAVLAVTNRPEQLMKNAVPMHRTVCSPLAMATTGTMLSPKTDLIVPPIGRGLGDVNVVTDSKKILPRSFRT
jgi:hypothetical protein